VLRFLPGGGLGGGGAATKAELAALDAKAAYVLSGSLADQDAAKARLLSSFCLDQEDNLLTCDEEGRCIRVVGADNTLRATWPLEFWPQAIACRPDGSVVVAGAGRVALLDAKGQLLASGSLPRSTGGVTPVEGQSSAAQLRYNSAATSVAATAEDIFVCARVNTGYTVYRLTPRLDEAVPVIKGLRGCCGQLDMTARDGLLYLAANSEFQVARYDREGKKLGSFGRSGKGPEPCFDGCCEPKNLCFGPDGSLYLAGSGKCAIGHYTAEGQFIEYVGRVEGITGCVRVTVAVNRDASRIYMLDTEHNTVRVLTRREQPPPAAAAGPAATPAG
jgi:DNA-binding beta-propeller fold protein YncE